MWNLLLPVVGTVIDKLFPDAGEREKAKYALFELQQAGELKVLDADLQLALAQIKVNETDAASTDNFRAGWRPAAGWVCSVGLAYTFLAQPMLAWLSAAKGWPVPPQIDMDTLMGLLMGLLGLGGFRTFERVKGKA
jgi:hypothetical protein